MRKITLEILIILAMSKQTAFDCSIIYLPQIGSRNGHIAYVNNQKEIPFEVKRVFYLYDIPGGESRGAL
jgi:hypothetical protein